jgi:nucleoside-diphosphate-sugar epimerase
VIVAITGGRGFIGRHLVARHCARGDQVRYLTRELPAAPISGATAFVGDLASPAGTLQAFTRGADVVYHCAAELRNPAAMQHTNVLGTANLLAAAGGEVGRWVQLSSTGVYGRMPPAEIDEKSAVNPANAYERTKVASDRMVLDAAEKNSLPCVLLRPSNVFATDMSNQSLFQLIRMIDRGLFFFIGPPGAIANYVHVENVVDALVLCATATLPGNGRTYIVSDHRRLEMLVQLLAAALGKDAPRLRLPQALVRPVALAGALISGFPLSLSRVDALTNRSIFRSGRIHAELGYEYRISLEAGMSELVRHWQTRPTGA